MKEKSYDIPAYKVGIVVIEEEPNISHTIEDYQKAIDEKRVTYVPFEDVDGLSTKYVKEWLRINEVMIQFYNQYQTITLNNNQQIGFHQGLGCISYFYIGEEIIDERLDMTIDKTVEQTMEELYTGLDDETKRCVCCFFERYQDKTYSKTKRHINKIKKNKTSKDKR